MQPEGGDPVWESGTISQKVHRKERPRKTRTLVRYHSASYRTIYHRETGQPKRKQSNTNAYRVESRDESSRKSQSPWFQGKKRGGNARAKGDKAPNRSCAQLGNGYFAHPHTNRIRKSQGSSIVCRKRSTKFPPFHQRPSSKRKDRAYTLERYQVSDKHPRGCKRNEESRGSSLINTDDYVKKQAYRNNVSSCRSIVPFQSSAHRSG